MENSTEQTLGEKRIRTAFNPSGVGNVNFIKENSARMIDVLEEMRPKPGEILDIEKQRLISIAQTAYEEAAMWAFKAATFNV